MPQDERMTIDERRKYLKRMLPRYRRATRREQGRLLDEMQQVTDLDRKTLIRALHSPERLVRQPRQKQRGTTYGPEVAQGVWLVSAALDHVCAARLPPVLAETAAPLAAFGERDLSRELTVQLETNSASAVAPGLARLQPEWPRLPRKATRNAGVRRDTPMKRLPWNEQFPGYCETDLVHHSGELPTGDYVHTIQWIDNATGWSERVAVLGRAQRAMEGGFRRMLGRAPRAIRELHPDNGREFFHHPMLRFFGDTLQGVDLSRSRPYQKNDNRFVEQKNHTWVRSFFGRARFDTRAHQGWLDALYERRRVYDHLFQLCCAWWKKSRFRRPSCAIAVNGAKRRPPWSA